MGTPTDEIDTRHPPHARLRDKDRRRAGDDEDPPVVTVRVVAVGKVAVGGTPALGTRGPGTPPNVFMASFLADNDDVNIGFGQWMLVGLPLSLVLLVITWFLLTKVLFRSDLTEIEGGRELSESSPRWVR